MSSGHTGLQGFAHQGSFSSEKERIVALPKIRVSCQKISVASVAP